jgi:hypothetical protein
MNCYHLYLDFLELRRRAERRLARPRWPLLHVIVFCLVSAALGLYGQMQFYEFNPIKFGPSRIYPMTVWAVLLAIHSLWVSLRSGAHFVRRGAVVEQLMREKLQQPDGYLLDDSRGLFQLHRLFERDLARRARIVTGVTVFALVNVAVWVGAVNELGAGWNFTAQPFILTGVHSVTLLAVWSLLMIWNTIRERNTCYQIEVLTQEPDRKRAPSLRLSDDANWSSTRRMKWSKSSASERKNKAGAPLCARLPFVGAD